MCKYGYGVMVTLGTALWTVKRRHPLLDLSSFEISMRRRDIRNVDNEAVCIYICTFQVFGYVLKTVVYICVYDCIYM